MKLVWLIFGLLLSSPSYAQVAGSNGSGFGAFGAFAGSTGTGGGGGTIGSLATTGPTTGTTGVPSTNFTVTLTNGTFNGVSTVTLSDGGNGGTFTPSVGSPGVSIDVVIPPSGTSFTFTYNAAQNGTSTIVTTNAQGWTNPASIPFTTPGAYTATGPSNGTTLSPSTNFMVTLLGANFTGTQTITINDGALGGTITPSVGSPGTSTVIVTPALNATGFTFTYTAPVDEVATLSFTNAQGWLNPTALAYTSTTSGGGSCNLLDFSNACNSMYIGLGLTS